MREIIKLFNTSYITFLKVFAGCFLFVVSSSCNWEGKTVIYTESTFENELQQAIINGYYMQVDEDLSLVFHKDIIYALSKNARGFSKDKFLFHLIRKDNSFLNLDFNKKEFSIKNSIKGIFQKLDIVKVKYKTNGFVGVRTGQFRRNKDKTTSNIWVKQLLFTDIKAKGGKYQNEISNKIVKNLLNSNFVKALEKDVFFKNPYGYYILISKNQLFVIADKPMDLEHSFMLHLIKTNNDFDNLSFQFKNKEYQQYLEPSFSNLSVAKIKLPNLNNYVKIRMGQYNRQSNIWVQEIWIDEIFSNELLRHKNEFKVSAK